MSRVVQAAKSVLRPVRSSVNHRFPPLSAYEGSGGTTWFFGSRERAPSIATFFSGGDVHRGPRSRVRRHRIPGRIMEIADAGGLTILRVNEPETGLADILHWAVEVPSLVDIHRDLPADTDTLRAQLVTSTTREDFRRIRRANFTYRVTSDPDAIREFHARHYSALVARQFPEDGRVGPLGKMLDQIGEGGELVCADLDGEWVAGVYNINREAHYALTGLGIRDADEAVRQKRVVAALIIRSLERAVETGHDLATLGRALPFLGVSGPVFFKSKWGGTITRHPGQVFHIFVDLRHAALRRMLSASPVIHGEGDELVASTWLEPGDKALQDMVRDSDRYQGISRWYVLGLPATLASGAAQLSAAERIVPVPVTPEGDRPLWLGEALPGSDGEPVAPLDSARESAESRT